MGFKGKAPETLNEMAEGAGLSSEITGVPNWRYSMRAFNPRAMAVSQRFSRRITPRSAYIGGEGATPQYEGEVTSEPQVANISADPRGMADFAPDRTDAGLEAQKRGQQVVAAGLQSPISQEFMTPEFEREVFGDIMGPGLYSAVGDTTMSLAQGGAMASQMGIDNAEIAQAIGRAAPGMIGATMAGPGSTMTAFGRGILSMGDLAHGQAQAMGLRSEIENFEKEQGYSEYGTASQRQGAVMGRARSAYQEAKKQPMLDRIRRTLGTMRPNPEQARRMHVESMIDVGMGLDPNASRTYNQAILNGMTPEQAMAAARLTVEQDMGFGGESDFGQDRDIGSGYVADPTSPNPADRGYTRGEGGADRDKDFGGGAHDIDTGGYGF